MKRKEILKKYAKGNKDAKLKVISLGMGVQSTALYLMSSMGYKIPRADVAIFSDTGGEYKETMELYNWLLEWREKNNGIKIIINRDQNLLEDILKAEKNNTRVSSIPTFSDGGGMILRQCTYDYKITPVVKSVRKILKIKPKKRMLPVEMWLGISLDEIQRMKESQLYNIKYFYPLIYHSMTRLDCINFFKKNNFPVPIKSGCVFCPFHNNKDWAKQKKNKADEFKLAIKVDRAIRNTLIKKGKANKLYLHKSCKPLEEIDFEDNQLEMFEGYDCEGYCGL